MRRRGFTLIELLAVIVILAIIALIAVPIILNIMGDTKKQGDERNKELYLEAIKNAIAKKNLTEEFNPSECEEKEDGNLTCNIGELIVEVSGKKPFEGSVTFDNGIVKEESVKFTCEPPSFANDSWDTIIENIQSGNIDVYKVGETKEITLTGEVSGTYTVRIANKSMPNECNDANFSQTACGFVIEFADIITTHNMNPSTEQDQYGTNKGGWPASDMRTYINKVIFNSLSKKLQDAIIDTKVISGYGKNNTTNFKSTDKLYLLSTAEVWENGAYGDTASDSTRQLDYYKSQG